MTRARDLVVLSGAGTKEPKGWLKLSEAFLHSAGSEILRKLGFSELPESGGFRLEALGFRQDIEFKPLQVPAGIERKPVTSLVENLKSKAQSLKPFPSDRRSFGSLGHMVLEELAKNNWAGDVHKLLRLFGGADEELVKQLVAARELLQKETAGATELFTEHPFVLKRGDMILDGTIDLLAQFPDGFKIFDYKFTGDSPESAGQIYAPQLAAYKEAVEKLHPGAAVSAALVLIGKTVQTVLL